MAHSILRRYAYLKWNTQKSTKRFSLGQFVIQESAGAYFSAVTPDIKCEQITQRSQKGPGGHHLVSSTWNILFNPFVVTEPAPLSPQLVERDRFCQSQAVEDDRKW